MEPPRRPREEGGVRPYRLLGADEPPAVLEIGGERRSRFLIAVDHASRRIPRRLGSLGLPAAELERHTAWDIGALEVGRRVAAALDAPLVASNYSRLARGLPHVEIEIRQDLILDEAGQSEWATRIARALRLAEQALIAG